MLRNLQERKFLLLKCVFQLCLHSTGHGAVFPVSNVGNEGVFEWQVWARVLSFPFYYL